MTTRHGHDIDNVDYTASEIVSSNDCHVLMIEHYFWLDSNIPAL